MKKIIFVFLLLIIINNCFAQKFEVIKELPFGEPIEYYEKWGPYEDGPAGVYDLIKWKDDLFLEKIKVGGNDYSRYFSLNNFNEYIQYKFLSSNLCSYTDNNILIIGNMIANNFLNIYTKSDSIIKPDYIIDISNLNFVFHFTENKLFSTTYDKNFVYWELLPEGKTIYHNAEQTKKEMEDGMAEHLGITDDDGIYFGETCITTNYPPNYKYYWNSVKILTDKYNNIGSIGTFLGTDKKGISYFYKFINSANEKRPINNPDLPITVLISALDSWTHEVEVISLPAGDWNPPRNKNGLIAVCSQCIDEDGNIYFTDCNKEKGCYEIKKLSNDWVKKYDFYNREVGRMNANHIPLQTTANQSSDNNGYNFDHEYLWILEHGKDLCKVRKVDGREGYVETKYINFGNENKSSSVQSKTSSEVYSKVAVNKILKASDNLRLRKEEATSSAIITTMQKGTKVKILKLGKAETIDGMSSNWVQVEVLADGKDKDGKEIKAGTIGWCYGGYLE